MNELSREERDALERLRDVDPPPGLAHDVRRALSERGLLRHAGGAATAWRWAGGMAAAAALVVIGYLLGQAGRPHGEPPSAPDDRPQFVLLVREFRAGASPAKAEEELIPEYAAWARELGSRGDLVDGWKLAAGGRALNAPGEAAAVPVTTRPGETIAGLFIVRAADEGEALKLAASCPHARYGGEIEVRAIEH